MSTRPYDRRALGHELEEGEIGRWIIRDISGVITGEPYEDTGREIGPYQFDGFNFWEIYPTHFIVDPQAAMDSASNVNPAAKKQKEKHDREAAFVAAVEQILSEDIELGCDRISSVDLWRRVEAQGVAIPHNKAGEVLRSMGVFPTNTKGNWYSYAPLRQNQRERE